MFRERKGKALLYIKKLLVAQEIHCSPENIVSPLLLSSSSTVKNSCGLFFKQREKNLLDKKSSLTSSVIKTLPFHMSFCKIISQTDCKW